MSPPQTALAGRKRSGATALPLLIEGLRGKGLEPVSLTRLFAGQG